MRVSVLLLFISGITARDDDWESFKTQFSHRYRSEEEDASRMWTFKKTSAKIMAHNAKNKSFHLALNDFSDMTWAEFSASHLGLNDIEFDESMILAADEIQSEVIHSESVASRVDWVSEGFVTQVKSQGSCGSCWSFSAIATLESAWAIATGEMLDLSEQQLVDCNTNGYGCGGGWLTALRYVETAGICSETSYPYQAAEMTCSSSTCSPVIPAGGMTSISGIASLSQSTLESAVSTRPIAIAMLADTTFSSYGDGVLDDDDSCRNDKSVNHGVVVVGYGTESGKDYWKLKNSWGTNWGENGYARVLRGGDCTYGMSGVLTWAYIVSVDASTATTTTTTTTATTPDPTCSHGILSGDGLKCCAASCGTCGGSGCSALPGGAEACCGGSIQQSELSCSFNPAPCLVDIEMTTTTTTARTMTTTVTTTTTTATPTTTTNTTTNICTDANGIPSASGTLCCAASCGTCGGSGCSALPGGAAGCCGGTIKQSGLSCSENQAPCNLPDPTCSHGILSGDGSKCCAASCGTCGGSGCSALPGGSAACCGGSIKQSGLSCSFNQAPCLVDAGVTHIMNSVDSAAHGLATVTAISVMSTFSAALAKVAGQV